jgi:hypothetical protein
MGSFHNWLHLLGSCAWQFFHLPQQGAVVERRHRLQNRHGVLWVTSARSHPNISGSGLQQFCVFSANRFSNEPTKVVILLIPWICIWGLYCVIVTQYCFEIWLVRCGWYNITTVDGAGTTLTNAVQEAMEKAVPNYFITVRIPMLFSYSSRYYVLENNAFYRSFERNISHSLQQISLFIAR